MVFGLVAWGGRDPVDRATQGWSPRVSSVGTAWIGPEGVRLELPMGPDADLGSVILASALPSGMGSNPVGLDRGQLGRTQLVDLVLSDDHLLLEARNLGHRAMGRAGAEADTVRESFATSILASLPVIARSEGRVLVDPTDFLTGDLHDVAGSLRQGGQGAVQLDPDRSRVLPYRTGAFADNLALFAAVTFAGTDLGDEVQAVVPDPRSITLTVAQLWIRPPDPGFAPKADDPRSGFFGVDFLDHAAPPGAALARRYAARHRVSAEEPLIYYIDAGAPEPMRQALVDGTRWWADAFAAAGLPDAFRVEILPEDRSPYDVDVNVVQWVHRATRGWSYGDAVLDPRSGEILKGHVTLGSQRVRHDRLLFEALLGTAATGTGAADDPEALALARLRQLAAHEVGHTLGLRHNFAASAVDRASVMDYPAPWLSVDGDRIVTDGAYGVGVGAWDRAAIAWGYGDGDVADLAAMPYVTDRDARGYGACHPAGHLWDNGADPVDELQRLMAVRALALDRFGTDRIPAGTAISDLQDAFVLVYLLHRYQIEAVARQIGGVSFAYDVAPTSAGARPVDAAAQQRALAALVETFDALAVGPDVAALLVPEAPGGALRGPLASRTGTFDPTAAAGTAAALGILPVLDPARLARLADQHRADRAVPSVAMVVDTLRDAAADVSDPGQRLEVQRVLARALLDVVDDETASPWVRATIHDRLQDWIRVLGRSPAEAWLATTLRAGLDRPSAPRPPLDGALAAPMGPPI